jgi:melibiose permease/lactose/raffinose/galactose permease
MGGAISSGVVSAVIIVSGIKDADSAAEVSAQGLLMMKIAMLVFPLVCIAVSYLIYRKKYIIDSKFYAKMLSDLRGRGEIQSEDDSQ